MCTLLQSNLEYNALLCDQELEPMLAFSVICLILTCLTVVQQSKSASVQPSNGQNDQTEQLE